MRTRRLDDRGIAVTRPVDAGEHIADGPAPRSVPGLQEHGAEGRRERERVDGRDQHRHRDGDRELAEELASNARDEADRHEHGEQHQRDGDDRRGDLDAWRVAPLRPA